MLLKKQFNKFKNYESPLTFLPKERLKPKKLLFNMVKKIPLKQRHNNHI